MAIANWRFRFIVDVWVEPRDVETLPVIVRGKVRDLSTDKERYVGSFAEIEEVVEERLDDERFVPRHWSGAGE